MPKFPSKNQWRHFFEVLNKKEKISFFISLFLFLSSLCFLSVNFYFKKTEIAPARGGKYIEGLVGSPRFINPIYANSDVDRDLVELIFSGLMKYDSTGLKPDLAKDYKILENGKVYEFYLKEGVFWQDGIPLTADDVIFTIKTIQNTDIKSPLRANWVGVEVEKISDLALRFKLKNESFVFLENCTLKIIPKHIWENTSPENFPFSLSNLNPVGSGPYKLKKVFKDENGKITSLILTINPYYYSKKPYLEELSFQFYDSQEKLIEAWKLGEIKGLSIDSLENAPENGYFNFNLYKFSLPRYFAVFLNQEGSKIFSEKEVRQALNYGTDKVEILNKVLSGRGKIVDSPILPEIYNLAPPAKTYPFNLEKGKEILENAGFKDENGDGLREKIIRKTPAFQFKNNLVLGSKGKEVEELQRCLAKDSQIYPGGEITGYFGQKTKEAVIRFQEKYSEDILKPSGLEKGTGEVKEKTREVLNKICFEKSEETIPLKFSLTTVDQPILIEVANILKNQWEKLGAEIEIKTFDANTPEGNEILRKRDFDALLFGEVLGILPDPLPFWHSLQKGELGLNLSNYENKTVDKCLETARQSLDEKERKESLEEFQNSIIEDAPAIFLYNPDYLYLVSKEIKGINEKIITDPSKRFTEIENWYIKTKRVWK